MAARYVPYTIYFRYVRRSACSPSLVLHLSYAQASKMTPQKHWSSVSTLCSIFLLLPPGLCHMEMNWPYALRSKYNPNNTYDNIDYR